MYILKFCGKILEYPLDIVLFLEPVEDEDKMKFPLNTFINTLFDKSKQLLNRLSEEYPPETLRKYKWRPINAIFDGIDTIYTYIHHHNVGTLQNLNDQLTKWLNYFQENKYSYLY